MSLTEGLGLTGVDSDPNRIPDGKYKANLFNVKVQPYKDAAKGKMLIFTYKIREGERQGITIDEVKSANPFDDPRQKAYLKQRLLSLGVPESRLDTVEADDIIGTAVIITKKQNGEYQNVTAVELDSSDPAVATTSGKSLLSEM